MKFSLRYQPDVWSVMPPREPIDAEGDTRWLEEQISGHVDGPLADSGLSSLRIGEIVAPAARSALDHRRWPMETSLFFRPRTELMFGVMHFSLSKAQEGLEDAPLAEWLLPSLPFLTDPVYSDFETDAIPHGYRAAYVCADTFDDGVHKAGLAYGFIVDGQAGLIFSELAHPEVIGAMQLLCDPIVDSLSFEK